MRLSGRGNGAAGRSGEWCGVGGSLLGKRVVAPVVRRSVGVLLAELMATAVVFIYFLLPWLACGTVCGFATYLCVLEAFADPRSGQDLPIQGVI